MEEAGLCGLASLVGLDGDSSSEDFKDSNFFNLGSFVEGMEVSSFDGDRVGADSDVVGDCLMRELSKILIFFEKRSE